MLPCVALGACHVATNPTERTRFHDQLRQVYGDEFTVIYACQPKRLKLRKNDSAVVREICRPGILKNLDEGGANRDALILGRWFGDLHPFPCRRYSCFYHPAFPTAVNVVLTICETRYSAARSPQGTQRHGMSHRDIHERASTN